MNRKMNGNELISVIEITLHQKSPLKINDGSNVPRKTRIDKKYNVTEPASHAKIIQFHRRIVNPIFINSIKINTVNEIETI